MWNCSSASGIYLNIKRICTSALINNIKLPYIHSTSKIFLCSELVMFYIYMGTNILLLFSTYFCRGQGKKFWILWSWFQFFCVCVGLVGWFVSKHGPEKYLLLLFSIRLLQSQEKVGVFLSLWDTEVHILLAKLMLKFRFFQISESVTIWWLFKFYIQSGLITQPNILKRSMSWSMIRTCLMILLPKENKLSPKFCLKSL